MLDRVLAENPWGGAGRQLTAGSTGAGLIDVEADALGERKFATEIDRAGDAAHVALPGVRAGFTTAARLLFAAKGTTNLGA